MSNKQARVKAARLPVALDNGGTVKSIIDAALRNDAVQMALASYIEGRGLSGDWRLEIQSARLVPVEKPIPLPPRDSA